MVSVTNTDGWLDNSIGDNPDKTEQKRLHWISKHSGSWWHFEGQFGWTVSHRSDMILGR